MVFTITEKHLQQGMPRSATSCPAALAILEQFPKSSVLCDGVHFFFDGLAYPVPPALVAWQNRFDGPERDKVGPISFELPLSVHESCEEKPCVDS